MATVTTQEEFRAALTSRQPEIILANDITLTAYALVTYAVTIKGESPARSLFWGSPTISSPDMLIVSGAGTLTLESIILDAQNRDGTLVQVNGGTLILNEGAVIQNVRGSTAQSGISVGSLSNPVGGTLIMNGGLVTGIDSADAIFCGGGTVIMNNDAAVSNNSATGVTVASSSTGGPRGSFTMTGNARITGNRSKQSAGGVILYIADMVMGEGEDDAPEISDNRPPSGHFAGGLVASDGSSLIMGGNAKIHGNYSDYAGGGILAQDTQITMRGNASITDNICDGAYGGGGARIHQGARLVMEDNAVVSDNTSIANGGGVYLQTGGILEMKGNSRIYGNAALKGSGIYKTGPVYLSQSAQVLDGLYFADISAAGSTASRTARYGEFAIHAVLSGDGTQIVWQDTEQHPYTAGAAKSNAAQALQEPAYCDNVPVVADRLTRMSEIHLEASPYVTVPNAALVIADKHPSCEPLGETERAAWVIPDEFIPGHVVVLSEALDQVLIAHEVYDIHYCHLYGAANPNPDSYSAESEFPIVLKNPGKRKGYDFAGWYNCAGELVTEIPEGTMGDINLVALWDKKDPKKIYLRFDGNAREVSRVPEPIAARPGECVTIPAIKPRRMCHCFMGWNTCPCGTGRYYEPGDRIRMPDTDVTLYAQWRPMR